MKICLVLSLSSVGKNGKKKMEEEGKKEKERKEEDDQLNDRLFVLCLVVS